MYNIFALFPRNFRKDELITKLCEEVCYLNNQIVEYNDTKSDIKQTDNM